MIFGGRKGAAILFIRECVFWGTMNAEYLVPFLSKFIRIYDFGGCKRAASACLGNFFIWPAKYAQSQSLFSPYYRNM